MGGTEKERAQPDVRIRALTYFYASCARWHTKAREVKGCLRTIIGIRLPETTMLHGLYPAYRIDPASSFIP